MIYLKGRKSGQVTEISDETWNSIVSDPAELKEAVDKFEIYGPNPEQQAKIDEYVNTEPGTAEKIATGFASGVTFGGIERDDESLIGDIAAGAGSAVRDLGVKALINRYIKTPAIATDIGVDVASGAAEGAVESGIPGAVAGAAGAVLGRLLPTPKQVSGAIDEAKKGQARRLAKKNAEKVDPLQSAKTKALDKYSQAIAEADEYARTAAPVPEFKYGPAESTTLYIPPTGVLKTENLQRSADAKRAAKDAAEAAKAKKLQDEKTSAKEQLDIASGRLSDAEIEAKKQSAEAQRKFDDFVEMIPGTIKSQLGAEGTQTALQIALADPALRGVPLDQITPGQFFAALGRAVRVLIKNNEAGSRQYRLKKQIDRLSGTK